MSASRGERSRTAPSSTTTRPSPAPQRRYAYRREPTPGGIDRMRRGALEPFDLEMYANLNTGVLEEYLDDKHRREAFGKRAWSLRKVLLGVAVGTLFAAINVYVGLKVGLIVYGAWYVAYLLGVGFRWRPVEVNLAAGAANGASFIVTGFVYVFPALYLLAAGGASGQALIDPAALPPLWVTLVATVVAGLLGVTYFVVFRRVWLVEDPLPYPSFESFVKLLDMAHDASAGAAERARHGVRLVLSATGVAALFVALRDLPLVRAADGAHVPVLSAMARGSPWYSAADGIALPLGAARWTWVSFSLSPLALAVGWFMRSRVALTFAAGSAFVWFVGVPLAVYHDVPVFLPELGGEVGLDVLWNAGRPSALLASSGLFRTLGAGAILGAGLTALLKMAPTVRSATRDLFRVKDPGRAAYVPGRGWYEWPPAHILLLVGVALVAIPLAFTAAGYPPVASVALAGILVASAFVLGAIACKVLGETSIEPLSGTSFLVFLLAFGVLGLLGLPPATAVVLGLLGTTVFATAVAMTGNVLLDFKNALYVGNTPADQVKAEIAGLVPGAVAGLLAAVVLSSALAAGTLDLPAPQARAFATLAESTVGGNVDVTLLVLGVAFGVLAEVVTGLGTAFAIGMFFPVGLVAPIVLGAVGRDLWEKRVLGRAAERYGWDEEKRTIRVLDTYMVATGLIVGEALAATLVAVFLAAGDFLG